MNFPAGRRLFVLSLRRATRFSIKTTNMIFRETFRYINYRLMENGSVGASGLSKGSIGNTIGICEYLPI